MMNLKITGWILLYLSIAWGQTPDNGMWMSFDTSYPYSPVTYVAVNVGDTLIYHQIANPVFIDPTSLTLVWRYDTNIISMSAMWFDVYDSSGVPFTWWILWEPTSTILWTYQGIVLDYFAFLMFEGAGPTFALPSEGSPWHIGGVKQLAVNPGTFVMDSVHPSYFGGWDGWTIPVTPVPVVVIVSSGNFDTLILNNFSDTVGVLSPSSGDWDVALYLGTPEQNNLMLHIHFYDISAGGELKVSVSNDYPPYTDMVKKKWFINFTGSADIYDIYFYYEDSDLVDIYGNPIDEEDLKVYRWNPENPSPEPVSVGGVVYPIINTVALQGYSGQLENCWSLGGSNPVGIEEKYSHPRVFLKQNRPNPFVRWTNITFGLSEGGNVNLVIYNSAGQRVKTLVEMVLNHPP